MGLIESAAETAVTAAVPEAGIPLKILGGMKSAASYLLLHPMTAVALIAGVFGAYERREAQHYRADDAKQVATIAAMKAANALAIKQATAAKQAKDAYNVKIAAAADQTAVALGSGYDAAVMRLPNAAGATGRADLPSHADAAESSARSGDGADVPAGGDTGEPADPIAILRTDALTCADNTARLQAVHDWAVALNPGNNP